MLTAPNCRTERGYDVRRNGAPVRREYHFDNANKESLMKSVLIAAAALTLVVQASVAMAADAKACKAGKVFNPDTGKCETVRGS